MTTEIKDSAKVTLVGTVKRRFTARNGDALVLNVHDNPRAQYGDEYTIWTDLDVAVGDRIRVEGDLSTRPDSYPTPSGAKWKVVRNVNGARLLERLTEPEVEPTAPVADDGSWTPGEAPPEDPWPADQWPTQQPPADEDVPW